MRGTVTVTVCYGLAHGHGDEFGCGALRARLRSRLRSPCQNRVCVATVTITVSATVSGTVSAAATNALGRITVTITVTLTGTAGPKKNRYIISIYWAFFFPLPRYSVILNHKLSKNSVPFFFFLLLKQQKHVVIFQKPRLGFRAFFFLFCPGFSMRSMIARPCTPGSSRFSNL